MEQTKTSVKKFVARSTNGSSEIQPFCETAAAERGSPENDGKAQISGQQLFSLFTADIIKSEKLFIR
ncbi:MAG: hypothetical protein EOO04_19750 [Chitinophagaceae bacterium]|nr:MAG: hypothetical protein EOO04_19750 [Chitinophagaceae bacterium]